MKSYQVNSEIIGKKCECIFTGKMVTGKIVETSVDKYSANVKVKFDEVQTWGNNEYRSCWSSARIIDEFGSLKYLKLL